MIINKTRIALKRITNFLVLDEMDEDQISKENIEGEVVSFKNVDVGWSTDRNDIVLSKYIFRISNINFFSQI